MLCLHSTSFRITSPHQNFLDPPLHTTLLFSTIDNVTFLLLLHCYQCHIVQKTFNKQPVDRDGHFRKVYYSGITLNSYNRILFCFHMNLFCERLSSKPATVVKRIYLKKITQSNTLLPRKTMKSNPNTRFTLQRLCTIVCDSDSSGFGILKCPSLPVNLIV